MSKYSGMSNDAAADAYAEDLGNEELRMEAIEEEAIELMEEVLNSGEIDGEYIGNFLIENYPGEVAEMLNSINWDINSFANPEEIDLYKAAQYDFMKQTIINLLQEKVDELAETNVDERGDDV
jgi:hypothetical protein